MTAAPNPGDGFGLLPPNVRRADSWEYDGRGNPTYHKRLLGRNDPTHSLDPSTPGEFDETRSFTPADQADGASRRTATPSGLVTSAYSPSYDGRGNLRDDGSRYFQYDGQSHLTQVRLDDGVTTGGKLSASFGYDAVGHRTSARYDANGDGSVANDEADMYVYDAFWRVTAVVRVTPVLNGSGQPTGNFTKYVRERYVYSPMFSAGDGAGGDTPIGRQIDLDGDGLFDVEQFFLTDRQGSVVGVMEREDTNHDGIPDSTPRLIARVAYTMYGEPEIYRPTDIDRDGWSNYDPSSHVPTSLDLDAWNNLNDDYANHVPGSELWREFLDYNRDGVVDSADTIAFTSDVVSDGVADENMSIRDYLGALPLYAGYWWDPHIGLYHVRNRVYDPYHATWLQRDPIGFAGGANLYGYAEGNPWVFTDPLGLWSVMRWAYTGDANASDEVYNAALDAAASAIPGVAVTVVELIDTPTGRRILGVAQVVAGAVTAAGGALLTFTGSPVIGAAVFAVGVDMVQSGVRQTITGKWTPSGFSQVVDWTLRKVGVNDDDRPLITGVVTATVQAVAVQLGVTTVFAPAAARGSAAARQPSTCATVTAEAEGQVPPLLARYRAGQGGRWGGRSTRELNDKLATELEEQGLRVTNGAGRGPEEWIPGPGGGTKGGTFVDITATDGTHTIRIQTVSTQANGAPTPFEAAAAARIRARFPTDELRIIPKKK